MLTATQVRGLSEVFLHANFADPVDHPLFHDEVWDMCCAQDRKVAIAAPRGHAKSTAVSHVFVLASVVFRESKYTIIVSNTESQSIQFLADIKMELTTNSKLIDLFKIRRLTVDAAKEIVIEFEDGYKCVVQAIGAGQQVRGRKWGGHRPTLIVGDDLENDEMVESEDRREKFSHWFFNALVPSLSKHGKIRIVGTILHLDALLTRLLENSAWTSKMYKAHASFDDFSDLLWPEQWTEERLREERLSYIENGNPEGYSQEYLNDPIDQADQYFAKEDFLPMEEEHHRLPMLYYGGIDFAISDRDKRAYTVLVIGGVDPNNMLNIVHVSRFRGNADEIIRNVLAAQRRFNVEFWKAERGQISLSIGPSLFNAAMEQNVPLLVHDAVPVQDKRARARSIQARMKMGGVRFDKERSWYPTLEEELLHFPKGKYKDQVDSIAWLGIAINELNASPTQTELDDDEWDDWAADNNQETGISLITGY